MPLQDTTFPPDALSRIQEDAARWDARLRAPGCTEEDRARFAEWRDASAEHREAFEKLQRLVSMLRQEQSRAEVSSLRQQALQLGNRRRRRVWAGALAAGVCILAIGGALVVQRPDMFHLGPLASESPDIKTFATGIAQQSSFVLRDGSTVVLNAKSRIRVAFTPERRSVELEEGQALFQVAHNPRRPFVVRAGGHEIFAVGTQFDVRLDAERVQVTLIEGKVRVEQNESEEAVLTPGTQLIAKLQTTATRAQLPSVRTIDVARVTGWRNGRIFLEDLPLSAAVEEMNKHSPVQVRIADESLDGLRVNGMFRAGEQEAFVAALEAYFPIVSERASEGEIILTSKR
jgi:transmembrane sensor